MPAYEDTGDLKLSAGRPWRNGVAGGFEYDLSFKCSGGYAIRRIETLLGGKTIEGWLYCASWWQANIAGSGNVKVQAIDRIGADLFGGLLTFNCGAESTGLWVPQLYDVQTSRDYFPLALPPEITLVVYASATPLAHGRVLLRTRTDERFGAAVRT